MPQVRGEFDVKVTPVQDEDKTLVRMTLDKRYHGDLDGTAKGQMLSADANGKDSGVYVAIERVTGTLQGRSGSFLLNHTGIMTKGVPHLSIAIVPDSGSGQLTGLSGTMDIKIEGGKHFYILDYTLPQ